VLTLFAPIAVYVGVRLVFLYAVRRLDLYASGGVSLVLGCFVVGLLAFPLSVALNTLALRGMMAGLALSAAAAYMAVKTIVAPVIEELAKKTQAGDEPAAPADPGA
jgi:hypothetical protein